jgi:hypothetical protein
MKKEIAYKILWATIEDFAGLWEVLWEINTSYPDAELENKNIIKQILHKFLLDNLVVFYVEKWGNEQLGSPLNLADSIKALNQEENWSAPGFDQICIKISSTDKGEKYYNEELL